MKGCVMADPWAFGWTQVLTIIGLLVTVGIAVGGFKTFERWRREKIEENKIEIAFEVLSLAYQTKSVFDQIRNPNGYEAEWKGMPERQGETEAERRSRGPTYGILMRLRAHEEFFDHVWELQPKAMAAFGERAEGVFDYLHEARALVHLAAQALTWEIPVNPVVPSEEDFKMRMQLRADIWAGFGDSEEGGDRVERRLQSFRSGIKTLCQPVIDRGFRATQ